MIQQETKKDTTIWEVMKFFSILVLATQFDFLSISYIWSTTVLSKYILEPVFGDTGILHHMFDTLWKCICF